MEQSVTPCTCAVTHMRTHARTSENCSIWIHMDWAGGICVTEVSAVTHIPLSRDYGNPPLCHGGGRLYPLPHISYATEENLYSMLCMDYMPC